MAKVHSLEASEREASGKEKKLPAEEANLVLQRQQSKAERQLKNPTLPNTKKYRQCGLTWPHNATCKKISMPQIWQTKPFGQNVPYKSSKTTTMC